MSPTPSSDLHVEGVAPRIDFAPEREPSHFMELLLKQCLNFLLVRANRIFSDKCD